MTDQIREAAVRRTAKPSRLSTADIARAWVEQWAGATADQEGASVAQLFLIDGWWRDLLPFTWDIFTVSGRAQIARLVDERGGWADVRSVVFDPKGQASRSEFAGRDCIICEFTFDSLMGPSRGYLRLCRDDDGAWRAWTLLTELVGLHERAEQVTSWADADDPQWFKGGVAGQPNWKEALDSERSSPDRRPQVLVIGSGHSGLSIAARLGRAGVDVLVVERNERVGDNWRNRYHNLRLHTPPWEDHMPYLRFPDTWPIKAPKDKVGDWLESYAKLLDIDVWTGASVVGGSYDETAQSWTVRVRMSNGQERILEPQHVVIASGLLAVPERYDFPGADDFRGEILHSSDFRDATDYVGRRAVVVGTGSSGHDIAQDLYEQGAASVTLVQRSPTYVMSFQQGQRLLHGAYNPTADENDVDLMTFSMPLPLAIELNRESAKHVANLDRELLDGLEGIGFGVDPSGHLARALQSGTGGYYIDAGTSRMLIDGEIGFRRGAVIAFTGSEVVLSSGDPIAADVVVLCTGYKNMRENARVLFGDDVADRCDEVWTLDSRRGGEQGSLWRPSGHPALWFMGGSWAHARFYSRHLSYQIRAALAGAPAAPVPSDRIISAEATH